MSLTSFLSSDPMQYTSATSQSSTQLPAWYGDYTQGILQNAAQWANQGYQQYGGPRVAPLSADQQSSYGTVAGAQGLGQGIAQQGVGAINNALQQPNASQAAQPYLNSASAPISSQMGQFMNPYSQQVAQTGMNLMNTQFNQQVLPGLQNQFTQAGQVYGGTNQGVAAAQLGAQLGGQEAAATANTLSSGFNTALGGAEQQQGLMAGLGSTAGGLANAAQNTGIGAGYGLGSVGTMAQNNALNQASMQNQMGQQQQAQTQQNYNTAYQDFLNQTNYPLTASQGMQGALQGIQVPQGQSNYQYSPYGFGMSPLAQAGSTYGALNSMFGNGGSLSGQPSGGTVNNYYTAAPAAKGGQVRAQLHLRRNFPSAYQQYKAGHA